jgi:hypothetical protein
MTLFGMTALTPASIHLFKLLRLQVMVPAAVTIGFLNLTPKNSTLKSTIYLPPFLANVITPSLYQTLSFFSSS